MPQFAYNPDEWAHDLNRWWAPLAELARHADCESPAWLEVLGVEEFFDHRLLEQVHLRTPWLCLAASALSASAARSWARAAEASHTVAAGGKALAIIAFELAVELQKLRWNGVRLGETVVSTTGLIRIGQSVLSGSIGSLARSAPDSISLTAGWLAHSRGDLPGPRATQGSAQRPRSGSSRPDQAVPRVAQAVMGAHGRAGPVTWGAAHLIERLAAGMLDMQADPPRPDDPPTRGWASVLLVSDRGEVGSFETRRQHTLLNPPRGIAVPDLARLAFIHATDDCLSAVNDAFTAARTVQPLYRPGELVSWNLQVRHKLHPLAERTVSGRSVGLGAYVAFRSVAKLGIFARSDIAFTGQVSPSGKVGKVEGASTKIDAATNRGISVVACPVGQEWQDPEGRVALETAVRAEDAVIIAAEPLHHLRRYLEAACCLVAPEPWLQTWLNSQGQPAHQMPLLDVMCRPFHPRRGSAAEFGMPQVAAAPTLPGPGTGNRVSAIPQEADVTPCPAHLVATTYPDVSFVITADAGCGCTVTAKRMVAEAARQAIDHLRAIDNRARVPAFVLPLYLPLGTPPSSWDDLIQAAVDALPMGEESTLSISAALAMALQGDARRAWRALVVVDGTDRVMRPDGNHRLDQVGAFIELITASPRSVHKGWRPSRPPQIVLCGRGISPAHLKAEQVLREQCAAVATMGLEPLAGREIDRFLASVPGGLSLESGNARELARNPLLLAISVIVGPSQAGEYGPIDLFDRAIDVLLGARADDRRQLSEIAFRAALAKGEPVGDFTLADIAHGSFTEQARTALASGDVEGALALGLDPAERDAFRSAVEDSHLLTASGRGWRFFHDRAFSFLVADRIARHAVEDQGEDDNPFTVLDSHLGNPVWTDVIEATGRLLELRTAAGGMSRSR